MSATERTRRAVPWWAYAVAGGLLVVAVVVAVLAGRGQSADAAASPSVSATSSPSVSASPTATSDASGSPSASASTSAEPSAGPSSAAPVATTAPKDVTGMFGDRPVKVTTVDAPAESSPGVTVRVTRVSAVTASGTGIGEYSGPALLVTFEIKNGTSKALTLSEVAVTAYATSSLAPVASVDSDAANVPFAGTLAPGATMSGSYIFVSPGADAMSVAVLPALVASVVVIDGIVAANG